MLFAQVLMSPFSPCSASFSNAAITALFAWTSQMRLFQVCFRRHSYEVCIDIIESAPEQNYREAEEQRSETYNHSFLPDIEHRYLRVTRRMMSKKYP